jgi:hypothetical protein
MSKDDEGDAADVVYMKTSPYDKMVQALRKCESEGGEAICFMKTDCSFKLSSVHSDEGLEDTVIRCFTALSGLLKREGIKLEPKLEPKPKPTIWPFLHKTLSVALAIFITSTASVIFAMGVISLADSLGFH